MLWHHRPHPLITEASFTGSTGGAWFEVKNITARTLDLRGLTIRAGAQTLFIGTAEPIGPGDYGVLASTTATIGDIVPTIVSDAFPDLARGESIALLAGSTPVAGIIFERIATSLEASTQLEPRSYRTAPTAPASWCLATESFDIGLVATPGFLNSPCPASVTAFAEITEIMLLPTEEPDSNFQWFEVRNRTSADVDLTGLQIVINGAVAAQLGEGNLLPANGLIVFGTTSGAAGGLVNILYGSGTTALTPGSLELRMAGVTIDNVSWTGSWPVAAGASMQVSNSVASNDSVLSWCLSTARYDATANLGTPGALNGVCAR